MQVPELNGIFSQLSTAILSTASARNYFRIEERAGQLDVITTRTLIEPNNPFRVDKWVVSISAYHSPLILSILIQPICRDVFENRLEKINKISKYYGDLIKKSLKTL